MDPDSNNPTNPSPAGNPVDFGAQDPTAPTVGSADQTEAGDTAPVAPESPEAPALGDETPATGEELPINPVVPTAGAGLPPVSQQPTVQPGEQGEALSE